jgi:endoglucanase
VLTGGACLALATACDTGFSNPVSAAARVGSGPVPCTREAVIDDGEDGDNQVIRHDGRGGHLYTYSDGRGSLVTPPPGAEGGRFAMVVGGANGSLYAARMYGATGDDRGAYAGLGFGLVDPPGTFDASNYEGIAFFARRGPDSTNALRVNVPDVTTAVEGQLCSECFNDFGLTIELTEQWQEYRLPFSSMEQLPGWGSPRSDTITSARIFSVQFQVSGAEREFDIWIDDLSFMGCP